LLSGGHLHALQYVPKRYLLPFWLFQGHIEVDTITIAPPHAAPGEVSFGDEIRDDAMDKPFGYP
jgi:hypothetical protein